MNRPFNEVDVEFELRLEERVVLQTQERALLLQLDPLVAPLEAQALLLHNIIQSGFVRIFKYAGYRDIYVMQNNMVVVCPLGEKK